MVDLPRRLVLRNALAALAAPALQRTSGAAAETVSDFYKGKQVRLIIRAQPGGNSDQYFRLLSRYMGKYIPGNPALVPVNMPGGGGLTALNYVANVAPRDGTVLTMLTQTLPMEQALSLNKNLNIDLRTFGWIGNMSNSNMVLLTSKQSGVASLDDARHREVLLSGTGAADPSAYIAALCNHFLGTRFKLIFGYPGGVELTMAVMRNETHGRTTSDPRAMFALVEGGDKAFNFILQVGLQRQQEFGNAPLLVDLAKTAGEKQIFEYFSKVISLARVVCTNSGVPPERIAALRQAFNKALAEPAVIAESKKLRMEIAPMEGGAVQRYVNDIIDAPPDVIENMRKIIAG
jgi:tripartite-type tricarboxylate transporter receptor subunit TctC